MYCYSRHTKISNNCLRWFLCNKSENTFEKGDLCFEYNTHVKDRV